MLAWVRAREDSSNILREFHLGAFYAYLEFRLVLLPSRNGSLCLHIEETRFNSIPKRRRKRSSKKETAHVKKKRDDVKDLVRP
jgi:hypothetical protein